MIQLTLKMVEIVAVLGTVSSADYYLVCLWSAAGFLRERRSGKSSESTTSLPPISSIAPSGPERTIAVSSTGFPVLGLRRTRRTLCPIDFASSDPGLKRS